MRSRPLAMVLFAACAVVGTARAQQVGDAKAGMRLAEEVCAACHDVGLGPGRVSRAPAFREVANRQGMNAVSLSAFLITPHPTMPNLMLSRDEAQDVIAYIMSLRETR